MAETLGWNHLSTDQLARHPGRPWTNGQTALSDDVIGHYSSLSTVELVNAVLEHYRHNVWPIVDAIVRSHMNNRYDPCLVFEGSAILPKQAVASQFEDASCIWLTATNNLITKRILESSHYDQRTDDEKLLIEAFLKRSLTFNEMTMEWVHQFGQRSLDVSSPDTFDKLIAICRPRRR